MLNTAARNARSMPAVDPRTAESATCTATKIISSGIIASTMMFSIPGWSITVLSPPATVVVT